jgi:hypothetical protein
LKQSAGLKVLPEFEPTLPRDGPHTKMSGTFRTHLETMRKVVSKHILGSLLELYLLARSSAGSKAFQAATRHYVACQSQRFANTRLRRETGTPCPRSVCAITATAMQMINTNAACAKEYSLLHKTILRNGRRVSEKNHSSVNNIVRTGFLKRLAYL